MALELMESESLSQNVFFQLREGVRKKNRISYGLLPNPPRPPPPRYGLFTDKKIYPHFFLEIESMIAKMNFTLGPIEKFIFFVQS